MLVEKKDILEKIHAFKDRSAEGLTYLGYYRMYFCNRWEGTFIELVEDLTSEEKKWLEDAISEVRRLFPDGMDYFGQEFLKETITPAPNGRYYVFQSQSKGRVLIEFTTEYGNADYPVRIYLYR